jgi:hypothetical protein
VLAKPKDGTKSVRDEIKQEDTISIDQEIQNKIKEFY